MNIALWLFWAVAGWLIVGTLGTILSFLRGRRDEALRHGAWVAAVAGAYLLALLAVSQFQKQRTVAMGEDQCFSQTCLHVTRVDETPGLIAGAPDRVVRVQIAVTNRGHSASEDSTLMAYLIDSRGREWEPLPGLSGNHLGLRIPGGSQIVSEPMFRVANDSKGLRLVLTHGRWQTRRLIIGDSDSIGHRPTAVDLGR